MKPSTSTSSLRWAAFTLIELLVVIAVITILASLIFPITAGLKRKRMIAVAQAELQNVQTAIESYKAARGHYPPDNPGNYMTNQLYFELKGVTQATNGGTLYFATSDGTAQVKTTDLSVFGGGIQGFVNYSVKATGDDEKAAAKSFLKNLKPNQSGKVIVTTDPAANVRLLTCSVLWDQPSSYPVAAAASDPAGMNPWRYISTNPTNNPTSYDLWVDIYISGKTNRISNWSKSPQIVAN